jgi:hypothetical protein
LPRQLRSAFTVGFAAATPAQHDPGRGAGARNRDRGTVETWKEAAMKRLLAALCLAAATLVAVAGCSSNYGAGASGGAANPSGPAASY